MKKTLTALCVLGAFAGSAMAADITISGVVDTGLMYTYTNWDYKSHDQDYQGSGTEHDWSMASGQNATSRVMIAGSEDLGNNMKVSFRLENGFNSDTGEFGDADRLFNRESSLSLHTQYGTVSFGRMGGVASSAGTYDVVYATAEAFDGGDNYIFGLNISGRYDNMVTYQSPMIAGLQATVQYSFQKDSTPEGSDKTEGKSSTDRYASAAVTGSFGALNVVAAYEYQNFATDEVNLPNRDDAHTYYIGGNYDCGFAKTFALIQYYDGARNFGWNDWTNEQDITETKGYGMHLGTIFPVAAGQMTIGLYYNNTEVSSSEYADKDDADYYGVSARYVYPLSKRTEVYAGAGYAYQKVNFGCSAFCESKAELVQAYMGLTHKF